MPDGLRMPGTDPYFGMMQWGQPQAPADYSLAPIARPEGLSMPGQGPGMSLVPGLTGPSGGGGMGAGGGGGMFDGFLSQTNANGVTQQGWGMPALAVGQGLMNAWLGMKQYGLAKQTLEENKRQFQLNYDAQAKTTNSALEDRQRARVASNAGAYQSVGDYMSQNRIGG